MRATIRLRRCQGTSRFERYPQYFYKTRTGEVGELCQKNTDTLMGGEPGYYLRVYMEDPGTPDAVCMKVKSHKDSFWTTVLWYDSRLGMWRDFYCSMEKILYDRLGPGTHHVWITTGNR